MKIQDTGFGSGFKTSFNRSFKTSLKNSFKTDFENGFKKRFQTLIPESVPDADLIALATGNVETSHAPAEVDF